MEELARLCGVPAYYIEERIANLTEREALMIPVRGKYRTDFIIWTDKYGKYCEENAEKNLEPVLDELFYLYGALVMDYEGKMSESYNEGKIRYSYRQQLFLRSRS